MQGEHFNFLPHMISFLPVVKIMHSWRNHFNSSEIRSCLPCISVQSHMCPTWRIHTKQHAMSAESAVVCHIVYLLCCFVCGNIIIIKYNRNFCFLTMNEASVNGLSDNTWTSLEAFVEVANDVIDAANQTIVAATAAESSKEKNNKNTQQGGEQGEEEEEEEEDEETAKRRERQRYLEPYIVGARLQNQRDQYKLTLSNLVHTIDSLESSALDVTEDQQRQHKQELLQEIQRIEYVITTCAHHHQHSSFEVTQREIEASEEGDFHFFFEYKWKPKLNCLAS